MMQLHCSIKNNCLRWRPVNLVNLFTMLLLCLFTSSADCQQLNIAVIYPEAPAPYNKVFSSIITGINEHDETSTHLYPLSSPHSDEALSDWLQQQELSGIIALGKQGYIAAKNINTPLPVVIGALRVIPPTHSGISLAAAPDQLFSQLKKLRPTVKRVFVVYTESRNGWIIELARQAANHHNLDLVTYPAKDLRQAVRHYRDIIDLIDAKNDAIWLPMDPVTANEDVILPLLLQTSWDKDLTLISSTPSHVQRGALFSLYPDNDGLGEDLAKMLQQSITSKQPQGIAPLTALKLAVNMRTAAHLGLTFSASQTKTFTLTFPRR